MVVRAVGFCRICGNDGMICVPRTGGFALVKDSADFLEPLITGEDTRDTVKNISQRYGVSENEVFGDMLHLYDELIAANLIEVHIDNWKRCLPRSEPCKSSNISTDSAIEGKNPVADFYHERNLLAELHIDLTDACTERCVHCYVPQGQCHYLPYTIVENVLHEFREQQGLTVQLSGGECMMHPEFSRICRLCRKLDLNFIVLSNLTCCDEKIIRVLQETDPQFVNVSLYSMVAEEHDAITQIPGSWKQTMLGINACQAAGIHMRLATPLLKANQHAYTALCKFAEERRILVIPDCDIIPKYNGDCSNLRYACTPDEVYTTLRTNKAIWGKWCGCNMPSPNGNVCNIGKTLSLNSLSYYYPCSGMQKFILGNAYDNSLLEVWKGNKMEYLRGLKNKDFPKCMNCEHRAFCKVCPAFNFNATGSLFEPIPEKCALAEVKHRVFGGE